MLLQDLYTALKVVILDHSYVVLNFFNRKFVRNLFQLPKCRINFDTVCGVLFLYSSTIGYSYLFNPPKFQCLSEGRKQKDSWLK